MESGKFYDYKDRQNGSHAISYSVGCCLFCSQGLPEPHRQNSDSTTLLLVLNLIEMTTDDLSLKKEILFKEEEKYQLINIGIIKDLPEMINQTLFLYKDKTTNKSKLLQCFYHDVIKFESFIKSQKESNKKLRKTIYLVSDLYLKRRKKNEQALLDKELKCRKITVSWFYPVEIFDTFYCRFCQSDISFDAPSSINAFFQKQIDHAYPLGINQYIYYLKEDAPSFWNLTCLYIKKIVSLVAGHAIFAPQQTEELDLIKDSTWSDTYEILRTKIQTDDALVFKNGTDFRNYIIKICNFRIQNLRIKYIPKEKSFDDLSIFDHTMPEEEIEDLSEPAILDVDIQNPYEIANAIAIILLDSTHPLYQSLTKGIEDKIDILLRKVIQGQNYNTIVTEKYGLYPTDSQHAKKVVKMRKEYERIRKTLQDRFIRIKKEQEKCHV